MSQNDFKRLHAAFNQELLANCMFYYFDIYELFPPLKRLEKLIERERILALLEHNEFYPLKRLEKLIERERISALLEHNEF